MNDNQDLTSGINQIIGGINELKRAINARLDDPSSWLPSHLRSMAKLSTRLTDLQLDLIELRDK